MGFRMKFDIEFFMDDKKYVFFPKKDMTAYETSVIFGAFLETIYRPKLGTFKKMITSNPNIERHFEVSDLIQEGEQLKIQI